MTKIAYFMNSYPMTSTTFIRREIEALERQGLSIKRYAVRHWEGQLVDDDDIREKKKTQYLLTQNTIGLVFGFFAEVVTNPGGIFRVLGPWFEVLRNARGGLIRHFAYLLQAISLRRRTKADGIDHLHVHFGTNATTVAMLSRIMGGPTYSFTVHGPDELTDAPLLSFPLKIKNAAFVAAITNFCKSQLIRFSSIQYADKIKIIHCGLELSQFTKTAVPQNRTFVCVGRLCPQKGQAQLPAAVAALKSEFPDLKIILIGDGDSREEVKQEMIRHNVQRSFDMLGWLGNNRVRELITEGRIFLLPSFAEGLPVVIMEALALGRPVISTYIAGIPELVDEKCGWIIPAGSHDALVAALRQALLASDQELAAMADVGRARIEAGHDINAEAAKLKALFTQAVDGAL